MKTFFKSSGLLLLVFLSALAHAETSTGVVRNINCSSHSFGFDVPPLIRMYTNSGTRFDGTSCGQIQEGDKVEVDYRSTGTGTAIATRVKVVGKGEVVKDMSSSDLSVQLNQNFLMGVSQTARVQDSGATVLKLRSVEFINTLCKDGYNCGGEGEVGMKLKVSRDGKEEEIILTSQNGRKPTSPVKVQVLGYEIQLIECGEDVVSLIVRKG